MAGDLLEQLRAALAPQQPQPREPDLTNLAGLMAFLQKLPPAYTPGPRESQHVEDRRNTPMIPGLGLTQETVIEKTPPPTPPLLAKLREVLMSASQPPVQTQV